MPVDPKTCTHPDTVEKFEAGDRGSLDLSRRGQTICARCGTPMTALPLYELERLQAVEAGLRVEASKGYPINPEVLSRIADGRVDDDDLTG